MKRHPKRNEYRIKHHILSRRLVQNTATLILRKEYREKPEQVAAVRKFLRRLWRKL